MKKKMWQLQRSTLEISLNLMLLTVSVKLIKLKTILWFRKVKPTTICPCWGLKRGQKTRPFNDAEKDKGQRKAKYIIIGETSHWTSVPPGKLITKHEDGTGKMAGGLGIGKLNQLPP